MRRNLTIPELRLRVADQIQPSYYDNDVLFENHFQKAVQQVDGTNTNGDVVDVVIKIMQEMLHKYAESEAKTKGGKVSRFFARITEKLLPIARFINFKKK